jgi:peptidoglycan/xylan/chitin deacetylase (PgdA/CDA1 family)
MRAILTYHSVDPSGSVISIDPELFRQHVAWLASGPVRVLPLARLLEAPEHEDAVALTFDDAFSSVARDAVPHLRRHGLPATVFVVTRKVGGTNDWDVATPGIPSLPLMGWEELGALGASGVAVEAHTRTHAHLPSLSPDAVAEEMEGSAEDLERELGVRPAGFAYPYGALSPVAVERARTCYSWAVTARLDSLSRDDPPHRLPRLDAYYYRDPRRLSAWGSARFLGHLWIRQAGRAVAGRLRAVGTGT